MPAIVEDSDEVARAIYALVDRLGELNSLFAVALPEITRQLKEVVTCIRSMESVLRGRGESSRPPSELGSVSEPS